MAECWVQLLVRTVSSVPTLGAAPLISGEEGKQGLWHWKGRQGSGTERCIRGGLSHDQGAWVRVLAARASRSRPTSGHPASSTGSRHGPDPGRSPFRALSPCDGFLSRSWLAGARERG